MAHLEGFTKYDYMHIYCAKLESGKQIYFLCNFKEDSDSFIRLWNTEYVSKVMYPMVASMSEDGMLEFEQYVDYSEPTVNMRFMGLVSISEPVPPVKNLYLKSIRRIEFLNECPDNSRKVLERVQNELKKKTEKVTFTQYRNEILRQTDRLIDEANGILEFDTPATANVVDITKGKPSLH